MSDDQEEDKQFEPSQKKLDDARKKGEIAKSLDLMTAGSYAGMTIVLFSIGPSFLGSLSSGLTSFLGNAEGLRAAVFDGSPQPIFAGFLQHVTLNVAIWFAIPLCAVVLVIIAQQAFVIAPTKVAPKASRISLISGVKNKFGRQGLFEFAKSFSKLMIYGVILGVFLAQQSETIVGAIYLQPAQVLIELHRLLLAFMLIVVAVATALGLIDFVWQRAEHFRKNRMSRKEMMDELKQSEGDPHMKQQRRQKGHEIAMNQMLQDVPDADVIIVNPTHFAVALKWDRQPGTAPICVAKGVDEIAQRIREVAIDAAVPIHSDPPTTRAIYATVKIGESIHQEHFAPVAIAIRFAESIRKKAATSW